MFRGALCLFGLGKVAQQTHGVEREKTNLLLLLFRGFSLQLFTELLSDLPQLALGVRSERVPKFRTHDVDQLENGCDKFLGVADPRAGRD